MKKICLGYSIADFYSGGEHYYKIHFVNSGNPHFEWSESEDELEERRA